MLETDQLFKNYKPTAATVTSVSEDSGFAEDHRVENFLKIELTEEDSGLLPKCETDMEYDSEKENRPPATSTPKSKVKKHKKSKFRKMCLMDQCNEELHSIVDYKLHKRNHLKMRLRFKSKDESATCDDCNEVYTNRCSLHSHKKENKARKKNAKLRKLLTSPIYNILYADKNN